MKFPPVSKPKPGVEYICIEGHFSDATGAWREGDRAKGDGPDVRRYPQFWAPATLTPDELFAERIRRFVVPKIEQENSK